MAYNSVAFKKSVLSWDGASKNAPADIAAEVKQEVGDDPAGAKIVSTLSGQVKPANAKLRDLLDKVINAKDDASRANAAKAALANVKQYQAMVNTGPFHHLPGVHKKLSAGLAELAKGLA